MSEWHKVYIIFTHLDQTRVSDNSLQLYGVDEGFTEGNILDAGVVETVNIVPD